VHRCKAVVTFTCIPSVLISHKGETGSQLLHVDYESERSAVDGQSAVALVRARNTETAKRTDAGTCKPEVNDTWMTQATSTNRRNSILTPQRAVNGGTAPRCHTRTTHIAGAVQIYLPTPAIYYLAISGPPMDRPGVVGAPARMKVGH